MENLRPDVIPPELSAPSPWDGVSDETECIPEPSGYKFLRFADCNDADESDHEPVQEVLL
jgi:hypothetical protein